MATGGVSNVKSGSTRVSCKDDGYKCALIGGSTATAPKVGAAVVPKTVAAASSPTVTSATNAAGGDADNMYFFEDEIYRIDKKGRVKFGLVVETSETYSGDEDDEFDLAKGEIRVAWHPEGKDVVLREQTVGLADRTIMPADVVRRLVPGKDTQRGYCREISMRADVKISGTKYVIKNVCAERLHLVSSWQLDTAVCLDSWVGSTKAIEETITLRSTYGSRFEVASNDLFGFKDVNHRFRRGIFDNLVFYPGEVITGRLQTYDHIKLLTPGIQLRGNKKGKPLTSRYTVESVRTECVWVHWQCKALSEEGDIKSSALQQPDTCVKGENLKRMKRLNLFESCMQQINDRNYLKISECDRILSKFEWDKEQAVKFKLIQKQQQQEVAAYRNMIAKSNITSGGGGGGGTHHFEKLKKKLSLQDADKNQKAKKFVIKMEKQQQQQQQQAVSKETSNETQTKTATNADILCTSMDSFISTDGWISDETEHADEVEQQLPEKQVQSVKVAEQQSMLDSVVMSKSIEANEDAGSTTTTVSTSSSPTTRSSPKQQIHRWQMATTGRKQPAKKLKKVLATTALPLEKLPKVGDEVVTESLLLYSTATVVWQDGTIESGIPSTQLYPIHHLDTHEFFPGDFVISGREDSDVSYRDYGVIQCVDHAGRIAHVKWFTTYASVDEPKPTFNGETEVSVYDLKDHPDFQYRPGIMVIRVANFVGEDATCTAGQIIDNYIDGRVKVWWVDGHISMCWPQDLFEVGQYDQTDLGGNDSEDSWETESENSEFGCSSPKLSIGKSHILTNIERARVAIARLEEIFHISPNLQNPDVMRKLMVVYKGCRYLDRLLNTNFFHEDNFMGLVERVRKAGTLSVSERAQDRKNRLFNESQATLPALSPNPKQSQPPTHKDPQQQSQCCCTAIVAVNVCKKSAPTSYGPRVLFNLSSTPFKSIVGCESGAAATMTSAPKRKSSVDDKNVEPALETNTTLFNLLTTQNAADTSTHSTTIKEVAEEEDDYSELRSQSPSSSPARLNESASNKNISYNTEKNQLLSSALLSLEKAFENTSHLTKTGITSTMSQDDSGNYSRNENYDGSSTSYTSSSDLTNVDANSSLPYKNSDDQKSVSCSSIELTDDSAPELVCVRLCTLLKDQLVKCIDEIRAKYYKENILNLSEVFEFQEEDVDDVASVGVATTEDEDNTKTNNDANAADANVSTSNVEGVNKSATIAAEPVAAVSETVDSANVSLDALSTSTTSLSNNVPLECFQILSNAPKTHKFHLTIFQPNNSQQYYKAVQREHRMLRSSLPPGVWVRVFEDRMDLVSVMIEGPKKTPYEDGLFFFDIQLGREYPKSPPLCHYISYCSDRLNPNLYEDGKVCVSLLGTWTGRDSEVWGPNSTLLQVIVSIQGLILVPEPYFNEAGYEKQKGTQQGKENSRMYNEMVIIKMVQATSKLLQSPPEMLQTEIMDHYRQNGNAMYERIKGWMELSKAMQSLPASSASTASNETLQSVGDAASIDDLHMLPEFPLVPASRGFCLTLAGLLNVFQTKLTTISASTMCASTTTTTTTTTAPLAADTVVQGVAAHS